MDTALMDAAETQEDIITDATEAGIIEGVKAQAQMDEAAPQEIAGDPPPESESLFQRVAEDDGQFIDDTTLEAEVRSFINQYKDKDITQIEQPAVVFSQLRRLHKVYCEKLEKSGTISNGVLTKYGIQRGMLLNIEKKLLEMKGKQWLEHYVRMYGEKSLRTAQDYMKLGSTPNIINYAALGKERLIKILRAVRVFKIKAPDPINTLFERCNISLDQMGSEPEETMPELKKSVDHAIAISRIKKAEEKNGVTFNIDPDLIKSLIDDGISVDSELVSDLLEVFKAGRDIVAHIEGLRSEAGQGDEMLPHYKKTAQLPKLIESLKDTVDSIREHTVLVSRIDQAHINELESCVAELRSLFENGSVSE